MKKKILLPLLTLLALCACDGTTITSSQSTSNDPQSSLNSSIEEKGWSNEEKALMQEHLYGVVLPYIDVGNATVEYDDVYDEVTIQGDATVNQEQLQAYKSLFLTDGWYDTSSQYADQDGNPLPDNIYVLQKVVEVEQQKRYLDVQFYAIADPEASEQEVVDEGKLVLFAYDDRVYEFPSDYFKELTDIVQSEDLVPEYKANAYEVDAEHFIVYCYTDEDEDTACNTYKKTLEEAKFTNVLAFMGYGSGTSPDGKYELWFMYQSTDAQYGDCLVIGFDVPDAA